MKRWGRIARRWLNYLNWPGVAGLGLLAFGATFYLSAILPAQTRLEELRQNAFLLEAEARRSAGSARAGRGSPAEQLAVFYRFFPGGESAPDWLEKIYQAAQDQGLRLEQGEYRAMRERVGKLTRYQITLPVKGSYPQIRKFLTAVLAEVPVASLDNVDFARQKIGDPTVEAKIRLTLYLR